MKCVTTPCVRIYARISTNLSRRTFLVVFINIRKIRCCNFLIYGIIFIYINALRDEMLCTRVDKSPFGFLVHENTERRWIWPFVQLSAATHGGGCCCFCVLFECDVSYAKMYCTVKVYIFVYTAFQCDFYGLSNNDLCIETLTIWPAISI